MMAVRPRPAAEDFGKTCSSDEGPIPGALEGPGQGDLLPLPDGELHAALELMAVLGVIAILNRAVTPSAPEHSAEQTVDSLWLIKEAVRPLASSRRFRKTCHSDEGSN
jgi:hypothetical protein